MESYYELKEMLCKELEDLVKKGELTAGSLDAVDKITHSIKSLVTIMAMDEDGYSNEGSYGSYEGNGGGGSYGSYNSYARGGRGGNRGGRGGNSREGMGGGRYSGRRYSRDEAADQMVQEFERLMEEAPNQEVRQVIQRAVQQLRNM